MMLELQGSIWPLGFAMKSFSMLRNRMLADPSFLFKIFSEVGWASLLLVFDLLSYEMKLNSMSSFVFCNCDFILS